MDETEDLLEDSWFFGNLLHTKTKIVSRSYSDLASSSHPYPPLSSTQESVIKNECKSSSFSLRKQPPVAPPSLTRTPSLPTSIETQSFAMKNPKQNHDLTSDQEKAIQRKSSSFSSRKQPPIAPLNLTRTPNLPNSKKVESFLTRNPNPSPNLTRTSSMSSTHVSGSDHEDEDEDEDEESEFTLGRLIRQASINLSHTSNPPQQTSKVITKNLRNKPEQDQEKISDLGKLQRNKSKIIKNSGKNKNGGGAPATAIPGGLVDKSSSEDMKAHIKFWARAVASNVRQECS